MSAPIRRPGLRRALLVSTVAIAVLVGLAFLLRDRFSLEELIEQEHRLRQSIDLQPWRSFAIGLGIYTVISLVPGLPGKSIILGWLFGFWRAVLMIIIGLTAVAMVMFYLGRYSFRDWIEHRYESFLAALNRHLEREGAFYLLTLRMAHFPFSLVNLASGASRVGPRTFCWTTALGLVPGTMVFAWVGVRLPSLDRLADHGVRSLLDAPLIVALLVSGIFPIVFRWVTRRVGILRDTGRGDKPPAAG